MISGVEKINWGAWPTETPGPSQQHKR